MRTPLVAETSSARPLRARVLSAAVLAAGLAGPLAAQRPADSVGAAVDRIFAPYRGGPGCAVSVVRDGAVVLSRGYGVADLEHDIPITPRTVFYAGSVSKQFTAYTVALLAQRGKLSLDDDVRKYVPELPEYGKPITVRHLLHHTSGLRDYYGLRGLAGRPADDVFGDDEVLDLLARQRGLNFEPGAEHLYSNSGYFLLSVIVKRVTGVPFRVAADSLLFAPLGMTSTHFHDDHRMLVKGRAYAYERDPTSQFRWSMPNFDVVGAGGLLTTVEDLVKWDRNFYEGTVGGRALVEQTITPGVLNDGTRLSYALGLTVGRYRGLRTVSHGGAYGGYRAAVYRFPDERFSVLTLCNLASIVPERLSERVADVYLARRFTEAAGAPPPRTQATTAATTPAPAPARTPTDRPAPLAPEALHAYEGAYASEELGATWRVVADSGRLVLRRIGAAPLALVPTGADGFRAPGMTLAFTRPAGGGAVTEIVVDAGRVKRVTFVRVGR